MVLLVKMKEGSMKLVCGFRCRWEETLCCCRVICMVEEVGYGGLKFLSLTDYYCSLLRRGLVRCVWY